MPERVGGHTKVVSVTPTVDTSAYASGDLIGGKLTLSSAGRFGDKLRNGTGVVQSVVVADKAKQSVTLDVVLFDTDPTGTTFTDNAAFAVADADIGKIIGVASVSNWTAFSDNSVGDAINLTNLPFDLGESTTIYAALVARGAPTYVAATDLVVRVGISQD